MVKDDGRLTKFRKVNFSDMPNCIKEVLAVSELTGGPLRHHGEIIAVVLETGRPREPLNLEG